MNTKSLLNEWKFFLLNEHKVFSLDEIVQTLLQSNRSEEDVNYLRNFWNSNRFVTKYTQVIQNELKRTQEPIEEILDVCKLHYDKIYQSAGPNLKDQIGGGNISINELRKQIDAKSSFNKNEVRQQCQYRNGRPVVGNYQDFDVVYSEADYIVVEPKTIQGSIAWAHGKPDGSEETDQKRRVGWCIGVSTGNNMFPNYAGNLHMFFVINTDYDNDNSPNRRLCLSFRVQNDEPVLNEENGSTVNALNRLIKDIENIKSQKYYQYILQTLQGRKQTSFAEIYSKITVSQLKRTIAQMKRQNIADNMINNELRYYIKHTNSDDVLLYLMQDEKLLNEIAIKVCSDSEKFSSTFKKILEIDSLLPIVAKNVLDKNTINFLIAKKIKSIDYELIHNKNVDLALRKELSNNFISSAKDFNNTTPIQDLTIFMKHLEDSYGRMPNSNLYHTVSYEDLKNIYFILFVENDLDEVVRNTPTENMYMPGQTLYRRSFLHIKKVYPEEFAQNFDFWFDMFLDNFYPSPEEGMGKTTNLEEFLGNINLNNSQINKLIDLFKKQVSKDYYTNLRLMSYLYKLDLDDAQNNKIKSLIKLESKEFARDLALNCFNVIDNKNLSIERNFKVKADLCLDLFNSSNESQKTFLAVEAEKRLYIYCPKIIKDYANNAVPMYLKLLSKEYLNLSFDEYSKLFKKANFDDFVKEYYADDNLGSDGGYFFDRYEDFCEHFPISNIVTENPEGVYDLFKSIGIDLSDETSINKVFFEDIMAWGYESLEGFFNDYPHMKLVFGRKLSANESLLKKYISLLVSK